MIGSNAEIKRIYPAGDGSVIVVAFVENSSGSESLEFHLLPEIFEGLDLSVGEVSTATLSALDRGENVSRAFSSACASFSFSPSSHSALCRKLIAKGFDREVAKEAIEIVRSRGFVDENGLAVRRAELCVGKMWGASRIRLQLREDGFDSSAFLAALEYLSSVDFADVCARLIRKKYRQIPSDRGSLEKMMASLSRYGFSSSDIREAIRIVREDDE